jgi:hypothetical protein
MNWGLCPDGEGRVGCGPQEEFPACADIAITAGGGAPETGSTRGSAPPVGLDTQGGLLPAGKSGLPAGNSGLPADKSGLPAGKPGLPAGNADFPSSMGEFPSSVEFPDAWAPAPPRRPFWPVFATALPTTVAAATKRPRISWRWGQQQPTQQQPHPPSPQHNYVFFQLGPARAPVVSYQSGGPDGLFISALRSAQKVGEPLDERLAAGQAVPPVASVEPTEYARHAIAVFQNVWESAVGYLANLYA